MAFTEKFDYIKSILEKEYKVKIKEDDYDAFIVKQLSESNCIVKDIQSNQSHIAITGAQMEVFPYIYSKKYIEENDNKMKNYFVIKVPVNIYRNNCEKIKENYIEFKDQEVLQEDMCVYPRSGGSQIQLSLKRNGDSQNFLKFRELIKPNDYLILMKKQNLLEYDGFIIEQKYIAEKKYTSVVEIDRVSDKNITFVSKKNIVYERELLPFPHQRIFFGAPGTGKSFELNRQAVENFKIDEYERVTFHPNYMYGHFVGAFKPFPRILKTANGDIKKDADGNIQETIVYEYVPGILMKQLIKALKNPYKNYLIIIEEINRSNVAAVFGDIFQLLDRNMDGNSEYDITTSRELQEYLKKELRGIYNERLGEDFSRLYLPFNLYIWATMNSADQGVMPLDTAFKRRWEFEYQGVDNLNEQDFENYEFKVNPSQKCNWNDYRKELNKRLSNLNIPEDKLIGPYFISKSILKKNIIELTKTIRNKLLMYLYEDVAKAFRSSLFAEGKYSTYSKLCEEFDKDALSIFRNKIEIETREIISEKLKNTNEGENEKEINVAENLNN